MGVVLKAVSPAYGGYTIARDEKVILIKGAVPGEVVEVEIVEKKRDYSTARVVSVVEASEHRVEPPCPVFGVCGGCQLQFIAYEKQTAMKDEILLDSLTRIGGIDIAPGPALTGEQWHYRRRAQFKVGPAGDMGFFREASRDVVTFDACPLMDESINLLTEKIKKQCETRGLSEIHIASGDLPVVLLRGRDYTAGSFNAFLEAGFSGVAFDKTIVAGSGSTSFDLNGMSYTVSPWSFFQAHWELNRSVVDFMVSELMPLSGKRVLDLYAGAGNFALPLARQAGEVTAVEENPHAVDDGIRNVRLNELKHCKMVRSSAEKFKIGRKYDIIVLDPPRPGLTGDVVKKLLETPPDSLVYISCNPATLARDLKKLTAKYDIRSVRQIDFFPNTFHIESIAFLTVR